MLCHKTRNGHTRCEFKQDEWLIKHIITGIGEYAYQKGYSILSTNVDTFEHAVKALDMIIGNRIAGLIFAYGNVHVR